MIEEFLFCKELILKEFELVIGFFSFDCSVVFLGRVYLRICIKIIIDIIKVYNFIRLNKEVKVDLYVWLVFLK